MSDDATAKMADPADFKVFETGLATDKSYTAKKAAIDADITALQAALDASKAAETMVEKWQNKSITVGEGLSCCPIPSRLRHPTWATALWPTIRA